MTVLERIGRSLPTDDLLVHYRAKEIVRDSYVHCAVSLAKISGLRQGKRRRGLEAFTIAERGRAQAFLSLVTACRSELSDDRQSERSQCVAELCARLAMLQRRMYQPSASEKERTSWRRELLETEAEYQRLEAVIRAEDPAHAAIGQANTTSMQDIQQHLLDEETALLAYLVSPAGSLLWTVTKHSWKLHILPPVDSIEPKVRKVLESLGTVPRQRLDCAVEPRHLSVSEKPSINAVTSQFLDASYELYATILKPAEQWLSRHASRKNSAVPKRLIVAPDDVLIHVPFELLVTERPSSNGQQKDSPLPPPHGDEDASGLVAAASRESAMAHRARTCADTEAKIPYLVRRFAVVYAPSVSSLQALRARSPRIHAAWPTQKDFGGFAPIRFHNAPALLGSAEEVMNIAQLFRPDECDVLVGPAATKDAAMQAELYRHVHYATHGYVDRQRPQYSGLLFSGKDNDERLQMFEMMNLRLNADLVTLSACQTGQGKAFSGEGLIGMCRALLYGGARSVCASLWSVDDKSTAMLMEKFYTHRIKGGLDKARALQQAKIDLLGDRRWSSAYNWSAFILSGDWN